MIELGLYVIKDPNIAPETRLQMIKEAGFNFVCLGAGSFHTADGTMLELCEKVGLPVDNIHLTGTDTTSIWSEGELGDTVTERYCNEIKYFSSLGIKTGIAHVTWGKKPVAPIGEYGLSRLERIASCAAKEGFTLALENSVYPEYLYATMERLAGNKYIGFCFDSGHRNAFAPNEDFLGKFGHILAATHIQDNDGKNDLHIMPLDGCAKFDEVARGLAKTELARRHITAEVAGTVHKERPGMSAEEIRESLSMLAIANDEHLLEIRDGSFTVYGKLSYEEKLERLHKALSRVAEMISAEIK